MDAQDEITRAYAILSSLMDNVPNHLEVPQKWVTEYHREVERLETTLNLSLSEFKVPQGELQRSESGYSPKTGTTYHPGLYCHRDILAQKCKSLLVYFSMKSSGQNKTIGFNPP